ncbi:hypothetical protein [Micromonospora sp. CPCC 206061]|uniref:hypothetical protein n=1 Tax=Micromonospora sp. CPCC 206061 TaxID=3122410 RepID=UPI002FF36539
MTRRPALDDVESEMATDGFDVELDDLSTFNTNVQRVGEDFRDTGMQAHAALAEFAAASNLASTGVLPDLGLLSNRHMTEHLYAGQVLQETFLGLTTLAMGANVIRTSYGTADGHGADALLRLDGAVVDKMFAPPKKGEEVVGGGASKKATGEVQKEIEEFLEQQSKENVDGLNGQVDGRSGYWIDPYDGSVVVTVPDQGGLPETVYESPQEDELGPDLPHIDKYNDDARWEESSDIRRRLFDAPGGEG